MPPTAPSHIAIRPARRAWRGRARDKILIKRFTACSLHHIVCFVRHDRSSHSMALLRKPFRRSELVAAIGKLLLMKQRHVRTEVAL